jgi:hypothetical protein
MSKKSLSLSVEHSLSSVPEGYRTLDAWPLLDEAELDRENQVRALRFSNAFEMRLSGQPATAAAAIAKVSVREFNRVLRRCLEVHEDGRIWGLRALPIGTRVKSYTRTAEPRTFEDKPSAGKGGLLGKLLTDHPQIEKDLQHTLVTERRVGEAPNRAKIRWCHKQFLNACRSAGVPQDQYPFNTQHEARRAFRIWMHSYFIPKYSKQWTVAEKGTDGAQSFLYQGGDGSGTPLCDPYGTWQIDEVTIDLQARYELPNWSGDWEELALRRCSAIRVIETGAGTTLAWRLILAAQPTAEELLMVVWDAMNGPPKAPSALPGLDYMAEAGFPANIHSQLRFVPPKIFELDNALSHLANGFQHLVTGTLGALVKLGAPRTPQARGKIEAKFKLQAQRVLHQLPATTGSGPHDPVRKKAQVPVSQRVRVDELEHILDVYIANENATPAAGAGYVAPLERLRRQVMSGAIRPAYIPVARRKPHFFNAPHPIRLVIDKESRRRPFVNFLGVRYTSPHLQRAAYGLANQKLWVRFDPRDLRVLLVFSDDGAEFGSITAMGQWGKFQHDLRIRKLFLKLKRQGELADRPEDEPLEAIFRHLRDGAPRDANKALQLAHLMNSLGGSATPAVQEQIDGERKTQEALAKVESVAVLEPAEAPEPPARRFQADASNDAATPTIRLRQLPKRSRLR